ncbi:hypothetical protein P5673_028967 [Acropora cervicornis]|uniref:Uncharacterized protein n=1 Tax=Acropora cervicornis TaxID=6130 RepID=A0AAD9UUS5_ACRCE|nr:hypothetical protein P5673_028967 [Acropora cervicornis]
MVLLRDMYMDDIFHSEETVEDAVPVREDLTKSLSGAGFRAQTWCRNRKEVLEEIQQEDRGTEFLARYITRGLGWDEEFPDDLKWTTHQWAKHLPEAPRVKIPLCYRLHKEAMENVSLHTFVDASRLAYAPISYARYGHVSGQISVALVTSKARVSPIKSVSIPRFALMAAVLGLRSYSLDLEIPFQKYESETSETPGDKKQTKRHAKKSPRTGRNQ